MPVNIGDIYIPNVAAMPESQDGNVEEIIGLGINNPITNTHNPEPMKLVVQGYLFKKYGTVKTAEQYAEDIRALLRDASYNYMNFDSRNGYLELGGVPRLDRMGDNQLLIPYTIDAFFHPASQFQRRFRSNPEILTNNFSLTFGAGGCDNYIPLPIGATYSGGDGSSITRAGKDGTCTLVKANTNKNINFDLSADEVNIGEIKVWDTVVEGDLVETNWIRVFNKDHKFTGDAVIENGIIRLFVDMSDKVKQYYYLSSWVQLGNYLTAITGSPDADLVNKATFHITSLIPDACTFQVRLEATGNPNNYTVPQFIIRRGSYFYEVKVTDRAAGASYNQITTALNSRFGYLTNDTLKDGLMEVASAWIDGGKTDNWSIVFDTPVNVIVFAAHVDKTGTLSGYVGAGLYMTALAHRAQTTLNAKDFFGFIPGVITTANLFKECEAMIQGSGVTYYTGMDASPKTGNTGSTLDVQNEGVDYTQVAGNLGHGATGNSIYKLFVRAKDSVQVANDLRIKVENTTDVTILANVTKTLTAAWAYYSADVTLSSTDGTTDNIKVTLSKDTATANIINLDYVLWVPIALDNGNGPQQIAHQALVNQRMKRDLILR